MPEKPHIATSVENLPLILIAEDNPVNIRLLYEILKPNNFRFLSAQNGKDGLDHARKRKPDLILLDIIMPEMDGFEVCRQLKSGKEFADTPVIFISALQDIRSKLEGFGAGGVDYISKPFQKEEVLARVLVHLRVRQLQKQMAARNQRLKEQVLVRQNAEKSLRRAKDTLEDINRNLKERVEEELDKRLKQKELLIQKSKLESLGRMAAGIAHEINQPLAGITMGLDNMEFKIAAGKAVPHYLLGKIGNFRKDIDRIGNIIDHVRLFSRDQRAVMVENIDVNRVCRDALSMLQTQYRRHDVRIVLDLEENAGSVLGNRYRLEQVILNLLTNAKDAVDHKADQEGDLAFQKQIRIGSWGRGEMVILEVEDNGIGIPEDQMDQLFEPFFTTKSPEKGTGLGLSISYGIVDEMKGEIRVESVLGRSTTISILLPRVPDGKE